MFWIYIAAMIDLFNPFFVLLASKTIPHGESSGQVELARDHPPECNFDADKPISRTLSTPV